VVDSNSVVQTVRIAMRFMTFLPQVEGRADGLLIAGTPRVYPSAMPSAVRCVVLKDVADRFIIGQLPRVVADGTPRIGPLSDSGVVRAATRDETRTSKSSASPPIRGSVLARRRRGCRNRC
jgi:hypothetical protein